MEKENIDVIIARVLTNNHDENDIKSLNDWKSESKENRKSYLLLKEKWKKTNTLTSHINSDRIYQKVQDGIAGQKKTQKFFKYEVTLKIAATVTMLIGASLVFYFAKSDSSSSSNEQTVRYITQENPNGIKSQIRLPDGSRVWLNAASSISYPTSFSDSARLVSLIGEAFFDVVKDKKRPFRVESSQVITTALGTSFNINAYSLPNIKVSLTTGKVDVRNKDNNKNTILLPGQQANVDSGELSVVSFDIDFVTAWKNGVIRFDDTEFDEMITILEKWYDVTFVVENLPGGKRKTLMATGVFENQSLENVLNSIGHTMKFKFTVDKKTITLKF